MSSDLVFFLTGLTVGSICTFNFGICMIAILVVLSKGKREDKKYRKMQKLRNRQAPDDSTLN